MFTTIFLILVSSVFAILGYLIKYKKKYELIAGFDQSVMDKNKSDFIPKTIAESAFLFAFLLVVFAVIYIYTDLFKSDIADLDAILIIFSALFISVIFYFIKYVLHSKK